MTSSDETITYACVGGPPWNWFQCHIIGADGKKITQVVEANSSEGWLKRYKTDENDCPIIVDDELVIERIECAFAIEVMP